MVRRTNRSQPPKNTPVVKKGNDDDGDGDDEGDEMRNITRDGEAGAESKAYYHGALLILCVLNLCTCVVVLCAL